MSGDASIGLSPRCMLEPPAAAAVALSVFRIGIDLGGTKIEGIVLDAAGQELFRKRVDTRAENGYRHILDRLKELYDDMKN